MKQVDNTLCIGEIDYTNVWPVFHHFRDLIREEIHISKQVPTGLNTAMANGEVHIGPISSFSYAEHVELYDLFPDLSVSCDGRVNSILLFHRKPLQDLQNSRVALPTTSATSVNLLKILLRKFYGIQPEYFYAKPDLNAMMKEADAALLIGDDAIRANWRMKASSEEMFVTDLGQCWKHWTGESMTYAVWAVRRDAIKRMPRLVESVYQAFMKSKQIGLQNKQPMIERAVREVGGTQAYWNMYFNQLNHDFTKSQQKGLSLYFRYAHELGLLDRHIPLHLWNSNTVA